MTKPLRLVFALMVTACATEGDDGLDCENPYVIFPDGDGDGFGDEGKAQMSCDPLGPPAGFIERGGDCRDNAATVNPGAKEVCDAVDNDCDGKAEDLDDSLDKATLDRFYRDSDKDGFGDPDETVSVIACAAPAGYVTSWTDCNDDAAAVNPTAKEVCDHIDNDCDGKWDIEDASLDMSTTTPFYRDLDNDQVGAGQATMACDQPSGYVEDAGDCNDSDNLSFPGGSEICDGADNDCDGGVDGTVALPNRCSALVGTYSGSYSHLTQEKVGSTVVNSMQCSGTGNASLQLNRKPGIQGTFTCTYSGGLTLFTSAQTVVLKATVGLNGVVTGTAEHNYNGSSLKRTYNVTGTQTSSGLTLTGTGSWYPSSFSAVPWTVTFNFSASK